MVKNDYEPKIKLNIDNIFEEETYRENFFNAVKKYDQIITINKFENNKSSSLTNKLIALLKTKLLPFNDFRERYQEIEEDFINSDSRMLYSLITESVYSYGDFDIITSNIQMLKKIYSSRESEENCSVEKKKFLLKVIDHIELSTTQVARIINRVNEIDSEVSKAKEQVQETVDKNLSKININVVTTLGIFAGISFVMFGGLSLFQNLSQTSTMTVFINMLMIGTVLINAIIILMQYVKSITNRESRVRDLFSSFKGNIPFIVMFNFISFLLITYFMSIIYHNNIGEIFDLDGKWIARVLIIVGPIVVMVGTITYFGKLKKKKYNFSENV